MELFFGNLAHYVTEILINQIIRKKYFALEFHHAFPNILVTLKQIFFSEHKILFPNTCQGINSSILKE